MVNFIQIYENKKPVTNKPMSYDIMCQRKIADIINNFIYYVMCYICYI